MQCNRSVVGNHSIGRFCSFRYTLFIGSRGSSFNRDARCSSRCTKCNNRECTNKIHRRLGNSKASDGRRMPLLCSSREVLRLPCPSLVVRVARSRSDDRTHLSLLPLGGVALNQFHYLRCSLLVGDFSQLTRST